MACPPNMLSCPVNFCTVVTLCRVTLVTPTDLLTEYFTALNVSRDLVIIPEGATNTAALQNVWTANVNLLTGTRSKFYSQFSSV